MQLIKNQTPDTALRNALMLAKTALAFDMPIVVTSSQEYQIQGPIAGALQRAISVPTVALGGSKHGLGEKVGEMVKLVVARVEAHTLSNSGHFMPEEQPDAIVQQILAMVARSA